MYYLLNITQHALISDELSHQPAWSLDRDRCIAHVDNGLKVIEYMQVFAHKDDVDQFKNTELSLWELSDEENFFIVE